MNERQTLPVVFFAILLWASPAFPMAIYDADFNAEPLGPLSTQPQTDPLPLHLPSRIIRDTGAKVDVVASAGNLVNKPVLLDSMPGSLACASFRNPSVLSSGDWHISWDSLVLDDPVDPRPEQGQVDIAANIGGWMPEVWILKYNTDGRFLVEDAAGFHSVGSFTVGVSDRFDLDLHLDTSTYDLSVNHAPLLSGTLIHERNFSHTVFGSNGRGSAVDLARFAFDNLRVVPEPSTALGLVWIVGALALYYTRKRWDLLRTVGLRG